MMVLEKEQEAISQMYDMINTYSVPLPPDDLVAYTSLEPSMNTLNDIIYESVAERQSSMDNFCSSLQKDIKELIRKVTDVTLKSQVHEK